MLGCLLGGLGDDRHIQAAADYVSDVSKRHALFGDPMLIWRDESQEDLFDPIYRDIELPFSRYIGLVITQDEWTSGPIEEVRQC